MAVEESASDSAVPALSGPPSSVITTVRGHLSLTRLQGVAGTLAAIISIGGGFGYPVPLQLKTDRREVLALVQEAATGQPGARPTREGLPTPDLPLTSAPPSPR